MSLAGEDLTCISDPSASCSIQTPDGLGGAWLACLPLGRKTNEVKGRARFSIFRVGAGGGACAASLAVRRDTAARY